MKTLLILLILCFTMAVAVSAEPQATPNLKDYINKKVSIQQAEAIKWHNYVFSNPGLAARSNLVTQLNYQLRPIESKLSSYYREMKVRYPLSNYPDSKLWSPEMLKLNQDANACRARIKKAMDELEIAHIRYKR